MLEGIKYLHAKFFKDFKNFDLKGKEKMAKKGCFYKHKTLLIYLLWRLPI